jgi:hypothetical protein
MTFVFKHPKYYTELRKRNKLAESRQPVVGGQQQSGQAISESKTVDIGDSVRPGQGLKQQASSDKLQAPSSESNKPQASSPKQQASSSKPQAASSKI